VKGGRILIVDDEPMVRETISRVLVEEGYTVDCAADGEMAIARCRSHPPDVILLDLMMPGMNGRQFLSTLRGELGRTEVPVVVMTAVHGLGQRALSLGADDMVEKPFDVDELLNKIALAMFRSRQHPPTGPSAAASHLPPPLHPGGDGPVTDDELPLPDKSSGEKGVVLLVDHDRASLQRLDALLSARGYTVVSMTRVTPQLPRLARVLQPRAVLLDLQSQGGGMDVVHALRAESALDSVPILVFSRAGAAAHAGVPGVAPAMDGARDEELLRFVEFPRGQA
jgi:DNA-binding response OmpR family regulator